MRCKHNLSCECVLEAAALSALSVDLGGFLPKALGCTVHLHFILSTAGTLARQ